MVLSRRLAWRVFLFGMQMQNRRRYALAALSLRLAIGSRPEDWPEHALIWLGDSLRRQGRFDRAQDAYQRCVDMNFHHGSADAAIALAELREARGDTDGAIDAYETALRLGGTRAAQALNRLFYFREDKRRADVLQSQLHIEWLISEALREAGHSRPAHRARRIRKYAIAALEHMELVERVTWAENRDARADGYMVLTDRRLMLLDDINHPHPYSGRYFPDCVLFSVARDDVDDARASRDDDGTWITVEAGSPFRARILDDPEPWIEALKPHGS